MYMISGKKRTHGTEIAVNAFVDRLVSNQKLGGNEVRLALTSTPMSRYRSDGKGIGSSWLLIALRCLCSIQSVLPKMMRTTGRRHVSGSWFSMDGCC